MPIECPTTRSEIFVEAANKDHTLERTQARRTYTDIKSELAKEQNTYIRADNCVVLLSGLLFLCISWRFLLRF